ncbi:SDR family oxidoreductase [Mycobacterium sp. 21AC1]|uniref:SDR family NAD(P)-dependent oxidoreductase n=1 Tax=[Mycobacterium] appelbergii TaxID=2939269 RepID=UPI002939074C|nr:SDR family NAD(P)-dependent oxidoreductase [Mycobacterium sp. 21AC1]MDV3125786.1 SDR family oxidoreductase [Mycobacterium sp. 21AC1]
MSAASFGGRTAIVTGAAGGIGNAIAGAFAAQGATVVIADLDGRAAERSAQQLAATGADVRGFATDVSDSRQVHSLTEFATSLRGSVDILVNNAAITTTEIIEDIDESAWRRVLDVNLTGPFLCAKAVLPQMRRQRYGKIVNIASVAAKRISFNSGASYTASKAGLVAFTRHLAYEAAPDGINVNAVCPGPVLTPMMESVSDSTALAQRRNEIPAGRISVPDDQAGVVLFLASDAASMVHGQAVDVDGGALLGWTDTASYFVRRGAPR